MFITAGVLFPLLLLEVLRCSSIVSADELSALALLGDSYGGLAALLAALSLIGVALSLGLQTRERREGRAVSMRDLHIRVIELALGDLEMSRALGPRFATDGRLVDVLAGGDESDVELVELLVEVDVCRAAELENAIGVVRTARLLDQTRLRCGKFLRSCLRPALGERTVIKSGTLYQEHFLAT